MDKKNNNNGKETLKVRIGSLEGYVKGLQKDVVDLKVGFGKIETKLSTLKEEQHETLGSVKNLCDEIKKFKDSNVETIARNSEVIGNIKGRMAAMWSLIFLVVAGLVGIAFTSVKTMMVMKDHTVKMEEKNGK